MFARSFDAADFSDGQSEETYISDLCLRLHQITRAKMVRRVVEVTILSTFQDKGWTVESEKERLGIISKGDARIY